MKIINFEKKKKNMFRHMTSYDGKLRHLPHQGVSTVNNNKYNYAFLLHELHEVLYFIEF